MYSICALHTMTTLHSKQSRNFIDDFVEPRVCIQTPTPTHMWVAKESERPQPRNRNILTITWFYVRPKRKRMRKISVFSHTAHECSVHLHKVYDTK